VYWLLAASGLDGVQVSAIRPGFHAHVIGTVGPAMLPWCRSMYCSIPVIID
jgi:hypothetical protein